MPAPTPTHLRRVALTIVAATAVVIGPTACDIGIAGSGGYASGPSGGGSEATSIETVPVGNTGELPEEGAGQNGGDQNGGDQNGGDQGEEQPPAEGEQPPADGEQPPAEGEQPPADGEEPPAEGEEPPAEGEQPPAEEEQPPAEEEPPAEQPDNNGLDVLGTDCTNSNLPPHDGFQNAPACVQSSHGEVSDQDQAPSLLITEAPDAIGAGEDFTLTVSTRNLIRDRFLGAAVGGYYLESSFLNDQGFQRGHFHTACRILADPTQAPDSSLVPEFFLATQDNGGSGDADFVDIPVSGLDEAGEYQCTVWAGDGSHRTPMMERANMTPAVDSVRVQVG